MPLESGQPLDYRSGASQPARSWLRRWKWGLLVAAGACVVLLACALVPLISWSLRVQANLEKASAHAALLTRTVAGDARFANVQFIESTMDDGTLRVSGMVNSSSDLAALKQIVKSSNPPVRVHWPLEDLSRRPGRPPATTTAITVSKPTRGVAIEQFQVDGNRFTVATVDLSQAELRLFWKHPDGIRFGNFKSLADHLADTGRPLAFATNAGIFDPRYTPVGLHVEHGHEFVPLNLADGDGNFYLKPNGVFLIDDAGTHVIDAATYRGTTPSVRLATQSGPLLLLDGKIHPKFAPQSTNRRIRSGVGVSSAQHVHFVLSHQPVTFHELATLFRDRLDCRDALYLDGVISRFHPPADGESQGGSGEFAGMFGVVGRP